MTAKQTKAAKAEPGKADPAADNRVVYVGPTIPGVATRNVTYSEVPESIQQAAKAAPYLLSLCVPIKRLGTALRQIQGKQGGIYTFYQKALTYKPGTAAATGDTGKE